jgi:RNase P subunit RPR2
MEAINFFNAINFLEPRCNKCNSVLKYGISTKFDNKLNTHICVNCGEIVR